MVGGIADGTPAEVKGAQSGLPIPLTRFVGRARELAELEELFAHARLVTVTGAAGSGKTRLALEVAARLGLGHRDGASLVDLAPLTDSALVPVATLRALRLKTLPSKSPLDNLTQLAPSLDTFVVLDNCEHLAEAAAEVTNLLLASNPRLRILATSRHALGTSGEQIWRLAPLAESEATQLFADRAHLQSGFRLTDGNQGAVDEICRRLDGLPLAIELAAARTRVLAPQQILERLRDAYSLLTDAGGPTGIRRQTLQAALDWSYRLLGPHEQELFDALSIFAGGFALEAAEAIGGGQILDDLGGLIDKSLVTAEAEADGAMRYRMLEVIRQYGQAKLAVNGGLGPAREEHATYYLNLALGLDAERAAGGVARSLRRFWLEQDNFRIALGWMKARSSDRALRLATALGRFWEASGSIAEGKTWLDTLLTAGSDDRHLLALALHRAARLAYFRGEYELAWTRAQESLAIKRELGHESGVARRLQTLAATAMMLGDVATAMQLAEESLVLNTKKGDARGLAWAQCVLGWIHLVTGNRLAAVKYLEASLPALRSASDSLGISYSVGGMCLLELEAGDFAAARTRAHDLMEMVDLELVWTGEPAWSWIGLLLAEGEGRYEAVLRLAGAMERLKQEGKSTWMSNVVARSQPAIERARRHLRSADAHRLWAEGASMSVSQLIEEAMTEPAGLTGPLSRREMEVARLVAEGLTNDEIASRLFVSRRTAESHLDHIKAKLGFRNRSQVVVWVLSRPAADHT